MLEKRDHDGFLTFIFLLFSSQNFHCLSLYLLSIESVVKKTNVSYLSKLVIYWFEKEIDIFTAWSIVLKTYLIQIWRDQEYCLKLQSSKSTRYLHWYVLINQELFCKTRFILLLSSRGILHIANVFIFNNTVHLRSYLKLMFCARSSLIFTIQPTTVMTIVNI